MNILTKKMLIMLSFVIPLGVMVGCMIAYQVQPFGTYSLVIIDGLHQYMPFYSVLYDKLKSGGSLFYTFRAGSGMNFLSLMAYYLSSPLNLIILFFKKTQLNAAVSILIGLKISLSGLNAGIYFSSKTKKPDLIVVAAAAAYALNSYMIGYCWNVMWLDAIMVLPLIIYGIERLIEKGEGWIYCLSLFYALYCNYYIGFMICIFAVIWYLTYQYKSVEQLILGGIRFAWNSLLAGGMAAIMLVPAYLGIRQTASGQDFSIPAHSFTTSFFNLFNRQLDLAAPISNDNFDGNINLYFGMFALLMMFLYFMNRRINTVQKIQKGILIVLFYLSFCEKILNFIWHGFHDQFGIPNRFSFLFGFLLLCMMVEQYENLSGMESWHLAAACVLFAILIGLSYRFGTNQMEEKIYGIVGMLFLVYTFLLFLAYLIPKQKKILLSAFCIIAVAEMCICGVTGFSNIGQIDIPKFFSGTEDMAKAAGALDDGTFYRSDLADTLMVDESAWYPLKAVGIFGSTAPSAMVDLMDNLGFHTGCNEYLYKGASPFTNALFGVRYLYYHSGDQLETDFVYKNQYGDFTVYENQMDNLSVGYMVDQNIDLWECFSDYPFYVQNSLAETGFGISDLFRPFVIKDPVVEGCTARKTNDGEYYFEYLEPSDKHLTFTIPVRRNIKSFFLHFDGSQVENTVIAVDGQNIRTGRLDGNIIPIGNVKKGEIITVTMSLKGEELSGYVRLSAADLDWDVWRKLMKRVSERAFHVKRFSDRSLEGTVDAAEDQLLMFTIPYDAGWKVEVDGEPEDMMIVGNALLAVPLDKGSHYVSLKYTPPGFYQGLLLSLSCWMLFAAGLLAKRIIHSQLNGGKHRKIQVIEEIEEMEKLHKSQD